MASAVRDLELDLDAFEGPFDLLLTLVLKEQLEPAEIDIAAIVVAFVEHVTSHSRPIGASLQSDDFIVVWISLVERGVDVGAGFFRHASGEAMGPTAGQLARARCLPRAAPRGSTAK